MFLTVPSPLTKPLVVQVKILSDVCKGAFWGQGSYQVTDVGNSGVQMSSRSLQKLSGFSEYLNARHILFLDSKHSFQQDIEEQM